MKIVTVYGSLLTGLGNHRVIEAGDLLGEEVVSIPFKMVSLGGFPGLIPAKENHDIKVEVYSVNDATYARVEMLEGYPSFYQKAPVTTSHGESEIYVLESKAYSEYPLVEETEGLQSWREHYEQNRRF